MAYSKNWSFTINNPTIIERLHLANLGIDDRVQYLIYQLEKGDNGTEHFQGYIQLVDKKRLAYLKTLVSERGHFEKSKGNAAQNRKYCSKEPRLEPTCEFGTIINPGKRTDIDKFMERNSQTVLCRREVMKEFPGILARYPRFVQLVHDTLIQESVVVPPFIPRSGWQTELSAYLIQEPDNRKIRWYFDKDGDAGKSYFARNFRRDGQSAYVVTGGKHSDIYAAYERESVVIFDTPRSAQDRFPYEVLESLKNGYFLSTKYEVRRVLFNVPHVIVFANFEPDKSKLSADRWDIHNIRNFI